MSAPFIAVCPSCSAKLKLKAAPAAGKKMKCPKCEKVFAPKVPKADADEDPWDLPDESSQGASDDEWGEEPAESSYSPSRSRRNAVVSRSSSGSGEFPTAIVVSIVGIFALIFLGLIAGPPLFRAIVDAMKPKVDPNYFIAGNLGIAIQLEPGRLLAMPDLPPAWRQGPEFDKASADFKAQLGVDISDIQAVRIAMPIPSGPPQPGTNPADQMRGQLILTKPPVFAANQTPIMIEGIPCYSDPTGKAKVIYCAGRSNTVLFAQEQTMRACLGAWKRGEARPPEPVLPSTLLSMYMVTAPISGSISQLQQSPFASANPMMPALQSFQTNVKSLSVGIGPRLINAGQPEETRFSIQFFADDDAKASAFATSLEQALSTAASQLNNPLMAVMLGEQATFAKTVVSAKPLTIGNTVAMSVPLPPDFMKQVVQSMPGLPGSGGSGLPEFPTSALPMAPPGGFTPSAGMPGPMAPGMPAGVMPAGAMPAGAPGAMTPGAIPAGSAQPVAIPAGHAGPPPGTPTGAPLVPAGGSPAVPPAHVAAPPGTGAPATPIVAPGSPAASPPKP
jgi:predicted Zn finger-like uncharacterized protein